MVAGIGTFTVTGAARELDSKALAHEVGSIFAENCVLAWNGGTVLVRKGEVGHGGSSTYGKLDGRGYG